MKSKQQQFTSTKNTIKVYKSRFLPYWLKNKDILVISLAFIGFLYQFATLSMMFSNDILTQNDLRLWNGYFPWWVVFFTFTFWSNFFVFITFTLYLLCFKWSKLKNDNLFLYMVCCYISVVLIVIAVALLPAAVIDHDNVSFTSHTNPLTMGALIMPHGPGPIYFIFFAMVVCSVNREGNKKILQLKYWKVFAILLSLFLCYIIMAIALNFIPIGAYYINSDHQVVYFNGYSVYSKFTCINPNLQIVTGGKLTGHGQPVYVLFYFLAIFILLISHTTYYFSISDHLNSYYNVMNANKINKLIIVQ